MEHGHPGTVTNPTCQYDWRLEEHFIAENFPHTSCIGRTGLLDVQGLVRSEMMIITGMMLMAMREKRNEAVANPPVGGAFLPDL